MTMKKSLLLPCLILTFLCAIGTALGQDTKKSSAKVSESSLEEEEEGPTMFKFEPDYLDTKQKRREEMARTRSIIDTLKISDTRRRKLLRDLYKNGVTKRLSKILVAETKFEDTASEDNE